MKRNKFSTNQQKLEGNQERGKNSLQGDQRQFQLQSQRSQQERFDRSGESMVANSIDQTGLPAGDSMIASQTMQEEAALVKRARTGDGDAFGKLYLSHLDAIYRYVYFRIGDQHEAEDLTEQVFLKAWEALPGYKDFGHPFTSWLYRIAHNLIIDYLRQNKPVTTVIGGPDEEGDHLENIVVKQILETEETSLLASAIIRLSEEQQQVIILRFVEGLNHAEVARILNKSEGACRMIQNRALIALNQLLSGPEG